MFDFASIERRLGALSASYARAVPWRHVVIDDVLEPDVAVRAAAAFPTPSRAMRRSARILGKRSYDAQVLTYDPIFAEIFDHFDGRRFTALVEAIAGIPGLRADAKHLGAGIHQGVRGSTLRVHADHNTHPCDARRFRRLSVLIYLTPGWRSEWGGELQLWDRTASSCRKRIAPAFNRCVILEVDDSAFHGYDALRVPFDRTRNALATYFYADEPADGQSSVEHGTIFPRVGRRGRLNAFRADVQRRVASRLGL